MLRNALGHRENFSDDAWGEGCAGIQRMTALDGMKMKAHMCSRVFRYLWLVCGFIPKVLWRVIWTKVIGLTRELPGLESR